MSNVQKIDNNTPMPFNYGSNQIRTISIDGEPFFLAKDICNALELSDTNKALKNLDNEDKLTRTLFVSGQNRNVWLVNESGLYNLIFKSRKLGAKKFKRWVTSEVLPTLRKTGKYEVSKPQPRSVQIANALLLAHQEIEEFQQLTEQQAKQIKEMKPKEEYYEKVLRSESTHTITSIAKELGMSAIALNKKLHEKRVQFKQDKTWVLYSKYQKLGYTETKTYTKELENGTIKTYMNTKWTEKGRRFIHNLLNPVLELPLIEEKPDKKHTIIIPQYPDNYLDMPEDEYTKIKHARIDILDQIEDDAFHGELAKETLENDLKRLKHKSRKRKH